MTDLQMILLISSSVFLAGLYWWGKKTKEQNTIKHHNLKHHGFRADTPEEEGMEVKELHGSNRVMSTPVNKAQHNAKISAREALDRASGMPVRDVDMPDVAVDLNKMTAQPGNNAIQGVMNDHSNAYLDERFSLSDPVTPKHIMQQARRQSPIHRVEDHDLTGMSHQQGVHYRSSTPSSPVLPSDHHSEHHIDYDAYDHSLAGNRSENHYASHQDSRNHHYVNHETVENHGYDHYDHGYDEFEDHLVEPALPSQIFALLVIDPMRSFSRRDIHNTMLGAGLTFSNNGIYVFYDKSGNNSYYIFRVANVNDTGYFPDPEDQPEEFSTNGVALILELPNIVTPYRAMNEFITAARRISQNLGGNLYDANRHLIKESHLREMREYAQSIT